MESSDTINQGKNDLQVLIEKQNKKRIISQDDNSLSLFAPSDVEEELQQEEDDPLRKVMFVVNDTEIQSEGHTDDT